MGAKKIGLRSGAGDTEKRTNEIGTIIPLLETLPDIEGRTITADALLTQRALATYLLDRGADYLFTVKGNQPTLLDDIRLTLDECIARRAPDFAVETPKPEHGRRERRSIWASCELNDYVNFPGVAQVFAVRRDTRGQVRQAPLRDRLWRHQPDPARRVPATTAHPQSRALDDRGNPPHPRLELRRGPQPHPHRARSAEHDPTAPLRHRPHQGARARRRRDHAQSGQETTPRPRLPEDDREHQPAHSAWLSAPSGRLRRFAANPPNPRGDRSCPDLAVTGGHVRGDRHRSAPWPSIRRPGSKTAPTKPVIPA